MNRRLTLIQEVEKRLSGLPHSRESGNLELPNTVVFRLAAADGADYSFNIWVYANGEPQICVSLIPEVESQYFWCAPFEEYDWPTIEARDADFLEALNAVLSVPTRIHQVRGLLFWRFTCEFNNGGAWQSIGGTSAFRYSNFEFPPIAGRRHTYYSPPLK